jgi:hypothetical protein
MATTRKRCIRLCAGRPISNWTRLVMGTSSRARVEGRHPPCPRRPAAFPRITSSQARVEGRRLPCPQHQAAFHRITSSHAPGEGRHPPCPRHLVASPQLTRFRQKIIRQNRPFRFRAPVTIGHLRLLRPVPSRRPHYPVQRRLYLRHRSLRLCRLRPCRLTVERRLAPWNPPAAQSRRTPNMSSVICRL